MSVGLAYARILAESAAWPFWAQCAFQRGSICLGRHPGGALDEPTLALAQPLEGFLRLRAGGASLETLRQVRDLVWFGPGPGVGQKPLDDVLRTLARMYFDDTSDGELRIRRRWQVDGGPRELESHELAHRLKHLTLAMPLDLLTASLNSEHARLELLWPSNPSVRRAFEEMLNRGIAEIHCHLSACLRFEALWSYLMVTAGSPKVQVDKLDSREIPFGDQQLFMSWLVTAALARVTMAEYLSQQTRPRTNSASSFRRFVSVGLRGELADQRSHRQALSVLATDGQPKPAEFVSALYRRFSKRHSMLVAPDSLNSLRALDPLGELLEVSDPQIWPEHCFARRGLLHLGARGEGDEAFVQLFWQYQRIRCMVYRYLTQETGTSGLDWFLRFFHRISPMRSGMDERISLDSAIQMHGGAASVGASKRVPLHAIEVRISPRDRWDKLDKILAKLGPSSNVDTGVNLGVIIHFHKVGIKTTESVAKGTLGDGRKLNFCRYRLQYRAWDNEASAIEELLTQKPFLLNTLRGLDTCGQELTTPLWPLLPILGRVRKHSKDIASRYAPNLQALKITLHAGEDFRTPLEGLRRIHEPIEFSLIEPSDRFGHAIALGLPIESWSKSVGIVWQPKEERLDDLLWLLERAPELEHPTFRAGKGSIEHEAYARAREIYLDELPSSISRQDALECLKEARRLRHAPEILRRWNYPFMDRPGKNLSVPERLLWRYLTDLSIFQRGILPTEVVLDREEQGVIEHAQRFLREKFRTMKLTVEANPSGNLLIAGLGALEHHPMFQLCPLGTQTAPDINACPESASSWLSRRLHQLGQTIHNRLCRPRPQQRIRVALSSDDPLTFATSLPEEISYTYYAIVRQGYSEGEAIRWVSERQQDARDGLFVSKQYSSESFLLKVLRRV